MFAEVIINSNARALNRIFDYVIPKELEGQIKIGSRVFVPFGNSKIQKLEDGFVINIKQKSEFAENSKLKAIAKVDEKDSLTESNIELAKLMAYKYFCNISDCIKLMLPPGTGSKDSSKRMHEKTLNFVYLAKKYDEIIFELENSKRRSEKQTKIINFLKDNQGIYRPDLESIMEVTPSTIKTLADKGYVEFRAEPVKRNPFEHKEIKRDRPKKLNEEQQKCFDGIKKSIDSNYYSNNLIFGITGSGKTEIYMQLIKAVLDKGKSSIMLVPEISLTPQTIDRFLSRFGDKIAVLHSKLSQGERFDEWQKIKENKAQIVVGARSAIFAPVSNLGLIIIDEEHDTSYKSEMAPRYNVKDLANYMAKKNNIPLVLGSATPEISTFYYAKQSKLEDKKNKNYIDLYTLTHRANNAILPESKIVDMRQELHNGNKSMLSIELQEAIKNNLDNKEQTILFLNRRGFSTFIMCRDCGYVANCPNCNISLTYHKYSNLLKCHYCGHEEQVLTICPECQSTRIKYFGTGTQKLEEEINKLYPKATTIRMDLDTVTTKNSHEDILNRFKDEKIDILIGTQMIAKGHDFPNVTLVGVVSCDGQIGMPDYNGVERAFQTIVQVSGRSGRGTIPGRVILQTYNPDHYAITLAQKQDYIEFFNTEINFRKMLKYPPFCDIILIRFNGENLREVSLISSKIYLILNKIYEGSNNVIFKPVPAPVDKIKNNYRWRIIIKGKVTSKMIDSIRYAMDNVGKHNVQILVDINPSSLM